MGILFNLACLLVIIWFLMQQILPVKGVRQLSKQELATMLKNKNYQFIDVRTPYEYNASHIKEFKNIPLKEIKARHLELSKDKEVVVICESGMRSNKATKILKKLGFPKISNVKGGMIAWRNK